MLILSQSGQGNVLAEVEPTFVILVVGCCDSGTSLYDILVKVLVGSSDTYRYISSIFRYLISFFCGSLLASSLSVLLYSQSPLNLIAVILKVVCISV